MERNIDLLGNEVKTGDIMLETGIAALYSQLHYQTIIEALSRDLGCSESVEENSI